MLRRDFDVFFFGTAMKKILNEALEQTQVTTQKQALWQPRCGSLRACVPGASPRARQRASRAAAAAPPPPPAPARRRRAETDRAPARAAAPPPRRYRRS